MIILIPGLVRIVGLYLTDCHRSLLIDLTSDCHWWITETREKSSAIMVTVVCVVSVTVMVTRPNMQLSSERDFKN